MKRAIEYLERPPVGWFVLDVMQQDPPRSGNWSALMVDVNPDDLKTCTVDFPALFYVHPKDHRPSSRRAQSCWVSIPGKHKNWQAAWDAIEEMMATRH